MKLQEVKNKIAELAIQHHAINEKHITDELYACETIEEEVNELIIAYAEHKGYLINGFPTQKREEITDEDEADDYFCVERFELYLDTLCIQQPNILELCWFYNNTFWPDTFETKEDFLQMIQATINPYDLTFDREPEE